MSPYNKVLIREIHSAPVFRGIVKLGHCSLKYNVWTFLQLHSEESTMQKLFVLGRKGL